MTESEWLTSTDPAKMLAFLKDKASDRKFRLFACACCRRIWASFPDPANRQLVAAVEDDPDGTFQDPVLHSAIVASSMREHEFGGKMAYWAAKYLGRGFYKTTAQECALIVSWKSLSAVQVKTEHSTSEAADAPDNAGQVQTLQVLTERLRGIEAEIHADLLRDLFGNPWAQHRPLAPTMLHWNDDTVPKLAQIMYDGRCFADAPILADALEEGGCTDAEILRHLREPGTHVRGCWVVDLILGKQ